MKRRRECLIKKQEWTLELRVDSRAQFTLPVNKCVVMDRLSCYQGNRVNTGFCGAALDTLLFYRNREKLNFDTNFKTISFMSHINVL